MLAACDVVCCVGWFSFLYLVVRCFRVAQCWLIVLLRVILCILHFVRSFLCVIVWAVVVSGVCYLLCGVGVIW